MTASSQKTSLGKTPLTEHESERGLFINEEKAARIVVGMEHGLRAVQDNVIIRDEYNACQQDLLQSSYDKVMLRNELESVKAVSDSVMAITKDVADTSDVIEDAVTADKSRRWWADLWSEGKEVIVITLVAILSYGAGASTR